MLESKHVLFFVGALGVFNGLMLGIYFLCFSKKRNPSTIFLGCLLVALSLRIGKSVYVYFNHPINRFYLQIGLSACLLIGPCLFFFVRSAIIQPKQLPREWRYQIIVLLAIIAVAGSLYPYAVYPELWNGYIVRTIYGVWVAYIVMTGVSLRRLFSRFSHKIQPLKGAEKWLLAIYVANILICTSFVLSLFFKSYEIYYSGAIIFSFVLYAMIFVHLYKGRTAEQFYLLPGEYTGKKINDKGTNVLIHKLNEAVANTGLYKNSNLTLVDLARSVNLTSHQLSQLLNESLGKNFTTYVNEYRINEACRLITAGHPFTLEAIGYEVGFNSKSTFYNAFKKLKGMTPLVFKESLLKASSGPGPALYMD